MSAMQWSYNSAIMIQIFLQFAAKGQALLFPCWCVLVTRRGLGAFLGVWESTSLSAACAEPAGEWHGEGDLSSCPLLALWQLLVSSLLMLCQLLRCSLGLYGVPSSPAHCSDQRPRLCAGA